MAFAFVTDKRQSHLAVIDARHGGGKKPRREEDVGLHRAVRQKFEFFLQIVTETCRIEAKFAAGPADFYPCIGIRAVCTKTRRDVRHRDVVVFLLAPVRGKSHCVYRTLNEGLGSGSEKANSTIPSVRRTAMCSNVASIIMAPAVAIAAPTSP